MPLNVHVDLRERRKGTGHDRSPDDKAKNDDRRHPQARPQGQGLFLGWLLSHQTASVSPVLTRPSRVNDGRVLIAAGGDIGNSDGVGVDPAVLYQP